MQFAVIIIVVIVVGGAILWYRNRNRSLSEQDINNAKRRIEALQERSKTQFFAVPGDERLKPDMEYLNALKKPEDNTSTLTFFTIEGISHTETNISDEDIATLETQGWKANAQRFTRDGMTWQFERPKME